MNLSNKGIELIKDFEKCRLDVYADAVGLATVGYGHRVDLPIGSLITQDEADRLFAEDLVNFSTKVRNALLIHLSDNQFSALVALAFNIGTHNFITSTLLKQINSGWALSEASEQFLRWNKAGGQVLAGLARRREAEKALFNS